MKRVLLSQPDSGIPERWFVLSLLATNYFTLYLHRNLVNYVQPPLKADLGLSDTELGWLDASFRIAYAIAQIGVGYFGDRYRRRSVLLTSLFVSSAMLAGMGAATNFSQLVILRILLAIAQSASVPAIASVMADCFTAKSRSRAIGVYLLSSPLSLVVAGWLGGRLADISSWRTMFVVFAGFGAFVWLCLLTLLREPERTERIGGRGLGTAGGSIWSTLWSVLSVRSFQLVAVTYLLANSMVQLTQFWLPRYLHDELNLGTLAASGRMATLPTQMGTVVGLLAGGACADYLARRWISGRFMVQLVGLLICIPAIAVTSLTKHEGVLVGSLFALGLGSWLYLSNLWATTFEVVDPAARATAIGLLNVVAGLLGAWLSPFVGALYESGAIASLSAAFLGTGVLAAVASCVVGVVIAFTLRNDYVVKDALPVAGDGP